MNDTTKLCVAGVAVIAILTLGPTACVMHQNDVIAKAIAGGADPIAASCAYSDVSMGERAALCAVYVAKGPRQ